MPPFFSKPRNRPTNPPSDAQPYILKVPNGNTVKDLAGGIRDVMSALYALHTILSNASEQSENQALAELEFDGGRNQFLSSCRDTTGLLETFHGLTDDLISLLEVILSENAKVDLSRHVKNSVIPKIFDVNRQAKDLCTRWDRVTGEFRNNSPNIQNLCRSKNVRRPKRNPTWPLPQPSSTRAIQPGHQSPEREQGDTALRRLLDSLDYLPGTVKEVGEFWIQISTALEAIFKDGVVKTFSPTEKSTHLNLWMEYRNALVDGIDDVTKSSDFIETVGHKQTQEEPEPEPKAKQKKGSSRTFRDFFAHLFGKRRKYKE